MTATYEGRTYHIDVEQVGTAGERGWVSFGGPRGGGGLALAYWQSSGCTLIKTVEQALELAHSKAQVLGLQE